MDPKEIAQALGITEDDDAVAAIANMKAEIAEMKAQIAADPKLAQNADMREMRKQLTEANQRLLSVETNFNNRLAILNEDRRQEQATAKVEALVVRGKIPPVYRDTALDLAMNLTAEQFDAYVATLRSVDLTERGMASSDEMTAFEPTENEIKIAKSMGIDTTSKEWRVGVMRQKAKATGLTLPAEVG